MCLPSTGVRRSPDWESGASTRSRLLADQVDHALELQDGGAAVLPGRARCGSGPEPSPVPVGLRASPVTEGGAVSVGFPTNEAVCVAYHGTRTQRHRDAETRDSDCRGFLRIQSCPPTDRCQERSPAGQPPRGSLSATGFRSRHRVHARFRGDRARRQTGSPLLLMCRSGSIGRFVELDRHRITCPDELIRSVVTDPEPTYGRVFSIQVILEAGLTERSRRWESEFRGCDRPR